MLTGVRNRARVSLALLALVAAGAAAAVLITARPALAWSINALPAGYYVVEGQSQECDHIVLYGHTTGTTFDWNSCTPGFSTALQSFIRANPDGYDQTTDDVVTPACQTYQLTGYGQTSAVMTTCDAGFQQQLDAFINATCPCAQTTTSTAATTTNPGTTTSTSTSAGTTSTATDTTATTTAAAPASNPPTQVATVSSTTATSTTTAGPTVDELQAQLDELKAQLSALDARVGKLEQASVDAWSAFQGAIETGATPDAAALTARSVAMNDLYGLTS